MNERDRHEHQIKLATYTHNGTNTYNDAVLWLANLDWFTDEQIEDIRRSMLEREWFRHKLNRENRRRTA